jgi:hypothetical protein
MVSEEFDEAVRYGGALCSIVCEYCGRVHFKSLDTGDFEEGELEELLEKSRKEPDKYIDWGSITIGWGHIGGKQYVVGCKCNGVEKLEKFVWSHRFLIIKYYIEKAKKKKKEFEEFAESLQRLMPEAEHVKETDK